MFWELSLQGEYGFYCDVNSRKEQKILNSVFTKLIAGSTWPIGTRYYEISKWAFTCRVKNKDDLGDYPACNFVYYDYSGGRLTDLDENDTEFQKIIEDSDAILGLLDGQKIQELMRNTQDPNVDIFLNADLPAIIKWMSYCEVPIQFVISKWDLLENEFTLKQIKNRLLAIPEFEELVNNRNNNCSLVRLIPVSSIGSGFAKLMADGTMKRISNSIPCPFQVEMPLACVLPDKFEAQLREISKQKEDLSQGNRTRFLTFRKEQD